MSAPRIEPISPIEDASKASGFCVTVRPLPKLGAQQGPRRIANSANSPERPLMGRKSPRKGLREKGLISPSPTPRQKRKALYYMSPFPGIFAAFPGDGLDGPNVVQSVFSIPLGSGAATASGAVARGKNARSAVLGEFIVGPENRLAAIAVKAVFEEATSRVTPLVLYGPGGCGKTHLARGLAEWWERQHPTAYVVTRTGAEFAQEYADAVENNRLPAWLAKLRRAQMLVLDDLGGLAGKRGAQQELRRILDDLNDNDGLVVVTSRSLPGALPGLSEALRSRFSGGLAVPVNIPGAAARQVIVERFAAAREMALSKRAMQTLADSLNAPTPVLLGALMELELAARNDGEPIDVERIQRYLASDSREKRITVREIATVAAKYFHLKLADLKSASRQKAIVSARNVAVYLTRQLTDQSLGKIGEYFGGRDHTTVRHGYHKIDKLAKTDPSTRQALTELKRLIAMT